MKILERTRIEIGDEDVGEDLLIERFYPTLIYII